MPVASFPTETTAPHRFGSPTSKLPDLEGLAIFAKVVEMRSFVDAATELGLSKATVSKAISQAETRLGARLFNRTSPRFALTDAGGARDAHMMLEGRPSAPKGKIVLDVEAAGEVIAPI